MIIRYSFMSFFFIDVSKSTKIIQNPMVNRLPQSRILSRISQDLCTSHFETSVSWFVYRGAISWLCQERFDLYPNSPSIFYSLVDKDSQFMDCDWQWQSPTNQVQSPVLTNQQWYGGFLSHRRSPRHHVSILNHGHPWLGWYKGRPPWFRKAPNITHMCCL